MNSNTVTVTQYLGGKPVATYTSIAAAARLSGARANHISEVISGRRNYAGGYSWTRTTATPKPRAGNVTAYTREGQLLATFRDVSSVESGVTTVPRNRIMSVMRAERGSAGGLLWAMV